MSAQGGTLHRRGTIELPIWPVAVLVIAAIAAAIGMTLLRSEGQPTLVTSVSESERLSNSTAAVREQGATLPVIVGISHVAPSLPASTGYAGLENPAATYIREASGYAGFENPAAYGTVAWGSIGGPNEALHRQYSPPREDGAPQTSPITINGQACMQCR
jgi:hypothetical protein